VSARQPEIAATWQSLAHKVIASVLVDPGAVFPVLDVLGRNLHWFPPKSGKVWRAVLQCVDEDVPPSVEAVNLRCDGLAGYVQAIANQWNEEDNRNVIYNAQDLKRVGSLAEVRKLGRELLDVIDPAQVAASIEYAEARLSGILSDVIDRRADAEAVSSSAWDQVNGFDGHGVPTGLEWYDDITGGLWPGMNYWVVGAYKTGKTTMMRNCVLHALDKGHAVDVFCAEGSREMFALSCQAMIATRLMLEDGERDRSKFRLSGLFILRAGRDNLAVFTKQELDALNAAREIWAGYNVRVWDTADGIRNLATLKHCIQKSKFEHGSRVHWCDYSQLFGSGETLFDRQSKTALMVQEIAQSENVSVCMLAQRNEAAIRGGETYSSGVKGGGDANAAADFELMPEIDENIPGVMNVKLKYSRWTGTGSGSHDLVGACNLIADKWYRRRPLAL
jgi:hypothetical protein